MSAALTAEGLNTFYGKSHILRRGSGHGPARPRRRRQDHDAAQPDGVTPPREGRVSVFGRETTRGRRCVGRGRWLDDILGCSCWRSAGSKRRGLH
jgi:hypothetical protein